MSRHRGNEDLSQRLQAYFLRASSCASSYVWLVILVVGGSIGCVDGPMFALKRMNPYYQMQWKADREQGVVFRERIAELRLARSKLSSMSPDELTKWSQLITDVYDKDTSPEMRREAVLALGDCPTEQAEAALVRACSDKHDKVRLAACNAMANKRSESAAAMLATVAQQDKTMSVRLAAIRSLGSYDSDQAKSMLRKSLDDKSPAVQFAAVKALETMTGRDFNGDSEKWRAFMDGQAVEEPDVSFAEQLSRTIGINR